jgi:hypothetical protein
MLPNFLVEEATVRECGESAPFALGEQSDQNLLVTLGITHAMEQESLEVDIFLSKDGLSWPHQPAVSFTQKFYCGTYQMTVPADGARFLKAEWRVNRWARRESRPFFRFYVFAQAVRQHAMAGAA